MVDPSQSRAFAINVIALLPYMLQNYEDANSLCIQAAENIAQVRAELTEDLHGYLAELFEDLHMYLAELFEDLHR